MARLLTMVLPAVAPVNGDTFSDAAIGATKYLAPVAIPASGGTPGGSDIPEPRRPGLPAGCVAALPMVRRRRGVRR